MNDINWTDYFTQSQQATLLDVRAPLEFERGHVPGALNLPLLSNEARAAVGLVYAQQGKHAAIERGLELAGPHFAEIVRKARELAPQQDVVIHCARGGMRSQSVAWLLQLNGFKVKLMQDGYKAYRNWVLQHFEKPWRLRILSGKAGAGKTELLHSASAQVVDLEALACHKGSVFGALPGVMQPTQQQFENQFAAILTNMCLDKPLWVECESKRIGTTMIPEAFFDQMAKADRWYIETPFEERLQRLLRDYAAFSSSEIANIVQHRLYDRLGGQRAHMIVGLLCNDSRAEAFRYLLDYYDAHYESFRERQVPSITYCNSSEIRRLLDEIF